MIEDLEQKKQFIEKFAFYRNDASKNILVEKDGNNTIMPWARLCDLTDEDLGAIYEYLRTMPPIVNKVEKFSKQ